MVFTNFTIQKQDGQEKTKKQISNLFTSLVGANPSAIILGMVLEEIHTILAPRKRFHIRRTVWPQGCQQTPNSKPP